MDNLKEIIYKLNNIILPALGENSDMRQELIFENNKLSPLVRKDLLCDYQNILNGFTPKIPPQKVSDRKTAAVYLQENKFAYAFCEYTRLSVQNPENIKYKKGMAVCLLQMKLYNLLLKYFIPIFAEHINEDDEMFELTAATYFGLPEFYEKAIPLYEKLLNKYKNVNSDYELRLLFLYEKVYQDKKLNIQIKHAQNALLKSNKKNELSAILANLYFRAGKIKECEEIFNKIMSDNPSYVIVAKYGEFLIKSGRIKEGCDKYRLRFNSPNYGYPKSLKPEKRWDGIKDISNSTVIVCHEQGFGDDIMMSRYIPLLSNMAGKVIFITQNNLLPLFKSSGYEKYCALLSPEANLAWKGISITAPIAVIFSEGNGLMQIPHDYHIPMFDLPYLMDESSARMTEAGGYLKADKENIEKFREKYIIKNDKLKVGFSYHGVDCKVTGLRHRDIPAAKFLPLFKMKGIDFYSFQADEHMKELDALPDNVKVYNIGKFFKDFEDTACAMSCMDLIITTDNVCLNLAGALGIKTYGLFNVFPEFRWYKTEGDDVGWYKSVRPFRAKTFNDWDNLILEVKERILEDFPALESY